MHHIAVLFVVLNVRRNFILHWESNKRMENTCAFEKCVSFLTYFFENTLFVGVF